MFLVDEQQDTTPPVTVKTVGQPNEEDGYLIWPFTPITLTATDDMSGVHYIHYEIWWDTDEDSIIDTQMASEDIYEDTCVFHMDMYGIFFGLVEFRWYAMDNAGNKEVTHIQQHFVTP